VPREKAEDDGTHQLLVVRRAIPDPDGLGPLVSAQVVQGEFFEVFPTVDGIYATDQLLFSNAKSIVGDATYIWSEPSEFCTSQLDPSHLALTSGRHLRAPAA
jgi:hypothetical protein